MVPARRPYIHGQKKGVVRPTEELEHHAKLLRLSWCWEVLMPFATAATQEILSLGSSCESGHGLRLLFAQGAPARGNPCPKIMQGLKCFSQPPSGMPFLGAVKTPGCAGGQGGWRLSPQLVFWRIDGTFAIRNSGAIWAALPTSRTSGLVFSRALNLGRPYGLFSTNPFLDLPGGRALRHPCEGLNENRPMLRYLRVEELASLYPSASIAVLRSW